jgi:ribosomal protein S18 acetylase RimI-like enzyme
MSEPLVVTAARPEDLAPAFRLIFRHVAADEREHRVLNALDLVRLGMLDPGGVKVVRGQGGVVGAVICAPVAGAGGVLWPAQAIETPDRAAIEDRLMHEALAWLRSRGAKLAQALLADHERSLGVTLERAGMHHITDLWYLRHDLSALPPARPPTLAYQTYTECDHDLFHETLQKTYEDTRDCPEVNGVRTIDEVIAGHHSQGTHDPDHWWLAFAEGAPIGVVMLTALPEWSSWDLIYLGVVKSARGHGIGRRMTTRALAAAHAAKARQLTLSVDVRNQAAWNLYRGAGFEAYDQRAVYLAILT